MNLINFHKDPKNEKYIRENNIRFCGQGLYTSYWIMPIGNGHNKYIFTVETNKKDIRYKIIIEEKHIIHWTIGAQYREGETDAEPDETLEFQALGIVEETKQYVELRSGDFTHLNDNALKVVDICIENDRHEVPFIIITNENQYCNEVLIPRQKLYYETLENKKIDVKNKRKIEYEELFDKNSWHQMMYFIINDICKTVIPFEIIKMEKFDPKNYGDDTMKAYIYYKWNEIFTNIKLFYNPENEDDYNISLDMIIEYEDSGKNCVDTFFYEHCYIVKEQ